MAKVRVGINGFGRIGRCLMRAAAHADNKSFEVVLINDLTDAPTLAHLLKYDSVHGRFDGTVKAMENSIVVNGQEIGISKVTEPDKIPWKQHGVDIVLECTGRFTTGPDAGKHMANGGVKKVIISAPAKNHDVTLALGINMDKYDPAKHHVISNASCTTNCLAPVAKVIHENFGIVRGFMTTIHSYTNDQRILDLPHSDLRRARAAALSMIPTSTGAAKALKEVLPELGGKLDGMSMRVPTPNVSCVDLTVVVEKNATKESVNEALVKASNGALKGIMACTEELLVSSDFNGDKHSATVDLPTTMVNGNVVKVLAWYDNEAGYTQRLFDLTVFVAGKL